MFGEVDRIEVIHTGRGSRRASKRRLWWDNELVAVVGNEAPVADPAEDLVVVETVFDSREAEAAYWDAGSGTVLPRSRVRRDGEWVCFDPGRSMLDGYAPRIPLPDATFFARLRCANLAIDPRAVFEIDLRLEDARPAGAGRGRVVTHPELVVSASADEMMAWCAGARHFQDLTSASLDGGDVFLLGVVAGVLVMSGGFEVPSGLADAAEVLVDLLQDHRAALDDHGPPL